MERQLHRLLIRMSRHICNQSSLGDLGSCLLNPGGAHLHHSLPPSLWRELLASWKPDGSRPPLHTSGAPPSTIAEVPLIATARAGVYTVVLRQSLGVPTTTSTKFVYAEFGKLPLKHSELQSSLQYLSRLQQMDDNRLCKVAFQADMQLGLQWYSA